MSDDLKNNKEFQEYRQQVHGVEVEDERNKNMPGHSMRIIFGIFMILVYVGMGILFMSSWFANVWGFNSGAMDVARYTIGAVLIIYGIWRGYRMYKGIDY